MVAPTLINVPPALTNATNTINITMPGSLVVGDLLAVELAHGGTGMSATTGWTLKWFNQNSTAMFYRWVDGTEAGSYAFATGTVSAITLATIRQIRGSLGSGDPFDVFTTGSNIATVNSPTLSMTTTVADTYLGFTDFKNAARTLTGNPTGFTLRGGTTTNQSHIFDKTQAAAGATGSLTATFSGGGSSHSTLLYAIKPATAQTVSPSGIASTSAVGTPALVQTITPSGIASTSAVGTPALMIQQFVQPTGIASASAVGTPTLIETVSPSGIGSTSAVGTPTLIQQQFVLPSGIAPTSAVGDPTLMQQQFIEPSGISSTSGVGSPSLAHIIAPSGIPGGSAVGDPTLLQQQFVAPAGIASTSGVGTPTLTMTIVVSGIASTSAVGSPTLTQGIFVSPLGIGPTSDVGTPEIIRSGVVAGVVYNHETGNPVGAGVEVKLFNQDDLLLTTTVTGVDGSYSFPIPLGDTDTFWTLANYEISGVQYHGVSDRGCAAL